MAKIFTATRMCLILVVALDFAAARKCYECNKCNDPFEKQKFNSTYCKNGVCLKLKLLEDGIGASEGDVIRKCFPGIKLKTGCEEGNQAGYKGDLCFCDSDECNGSEDIKFTIATGIMAVIAVLKIMYMF